MSSTRNQSSVGGAPGRRDSRTPLTLADVSGEFFPVLLSGDIQDAPMRRFSGRPQCCKLTKPVPRGFEIAFLIPLQQAH